MLRRRPRYPGAQVGLHVEESGFALACARASEEGPAELLACAQRDAAADLDAQLAATVHELGLAGMPCVAVLAPGEYALRPIEAPSVPPSELRAAVRWSLADLTDIDVENAIVDAFAVPGRDHGTWGRMCYAVAAPCDRLRQLAQRIEASGLRMRAIEIAELALRNLVARAPQDEAGVLTAAVLDRVLVLTATREGTLYVARWGDTDLHALSGELAKSDQELLGHAAAGPELDALLLEIQRSLDYYHHELGQRPASGILIAPLDVEIPELPERIGDALGVRADWLEVDRLVDCADPHAASGSTASLLAIGAALRPAEAS